MIIVTGTPGLVCITTDNMYESRKKMLRKFSMFNPLDLVQQTNGKKTEEKRWNFGLPNFSRLNIVLNHIL